MTPHERQMVRDAVKEASESAKKYRERRSLPKSSFPPPPGNQAQRDYEDESDRNHAAMIERDSAEIFSNVFESALRRVGAWIVFLE